MAQFGSMILTGRGRNLLAKSLTNDIPMKFTKVGFGKGSIKTEEDIEELNDLVEFVKSELINTAEFNEVGKAVFHTTLTTDDLTVGFMLNEFGIYAIDPDEGEILYSYSSAWGKSGYVPPQDQNYAYSFEITTAISNADNVVVELSRIETVDKAEYTTFKKQLDIELSNFKDSYDTQIEAINNNFDIINDNWQNTFEDYHNKHITILEDKINRIEIMQQELEQNDVRQDVIQLKEIAKNLQTSSTDFAIELAFLSDRIPVSYQKNMFLMLFNEFPDYIVEGDTDYIGHEGKMFNEDFKSLSNIRVEGDITILQYEDSFYEGCLFVEDFSDISKIEIENGVFDETTKTISI